MKNRVPRRYRRRHGLTTLRADGPLLAALRALGGAHGAACQFSLLASEIGARFAAKRELPKWRGDTSPTAAAQQGDGREVAFLRSTRSTAAFEPHNVRAGDSSAAGGAGYRVHVAQPLTLGLPCSGRTFLSAGLVEEQGGGAPHAAGASSPEIDRGVASSGSSPRACLTFRDEFCAMLPGSDCSHAIRFCSRNSSRGARRGPFLGQLHARWREPRCCTSFHPESV